MEPTTPPLNLNHLRLFLAVARHGSVTGGAASLYVSQPSVSRAIHELERDVGMALLERVGRGVRLTDAGRTLADYAEQLFGTADAARRAMDELRGLSVGRLRIGASTTIGIYLLPRVLGQFHARHPEIALASEVGNTARVVDMLRAFAVDLVLVEGPVADDELVVESFGSDELVLLAPPGHPFAAAGEIAPEALETVPFLAREPGSGTREVVDAALSAHGITPVLAMELGHTEAIKQGIIAGLGLSILSRLTVERELRDGALVPVAMRGVSIARRLWLARRRGVEPSPAARAFLELLDERRQSDSSGPSSDREMTH